MDDYCTRANEPLIPPLNFSMVAKGVYRSGYPNKKNFPFLKKLGLKSLVYVVLNYLSYRSRYLCPEEYPEANKKFIEESNIQVFHIGIRGNKVLV